MLKWIAGVLGTVVAGLLLAYAMNAFGPSKEPIGGGREIEDSRSDDGNGVPAAPKRVVMGTLEIGTNRQGMDFDAFGKPAGNEQLCAEMCRVDSACDAMTYVKSTGICWMKNGVPPASADADMISSVKVKRGG